LFCFKKIRSTENKVVDLNNHVLQIKSELEDSQRQLLKNTQSEKNLKDELEHVKIQYLDMQRAERTVRIDLEQSRRMVSSLLVQKHSIKDFF
jgi:chromosome segregation ATPase